MEYDILMPICAFLLAYLLGGIPTSIIVGKLFFKQDPREHGSHNPGGTNATRLWGKKIGFSIIAFDMIKALAPTWIALLVFRFSGLKDLMCEDAIMRGIWLSALGSVLGHCFSVYLKFTGGKGVSTYIGSLGSTNLLALFCGLISFLTTLFTKKMVSLASIIMSAGTCFISWVLFIIHATGDLVVKNVINNMFIVSTNLISMNIAYPIVVTLMTAVLILRHYQNIKRIKDGTEKRIK